MPTLPEPEWLTNLSEVQKAFIETGGLCNTRFTPSIATGIFLRLLQAHFADPNNIKDEKLKQLIWKDDKVSDDQIESQLLIGPLYKYDKRTIQQRPAILVMRDRATSKKLPLNSKKVTSLEANGNFRGDHYLVPVNCAHIIRCVAKTAFDADRIGEEVFYRLLEYFPVIKQDFPFSNISITDLTAPQKVADESNENFVVDVVVQWVHIHSWTLSPIAPILKKVRLGNSTFDE